MEPIRVNVQSTPNPNALKFIVNRTVKTQGKATYKSAEDCHTNPLARLLFSIPHVVELHFFENVITVSQDGEGDWDALEEKIRIIINENVANHNPDFEIAETPKKVTPASMELAQIEAILDRTVRPALQGDGGDLQVISLDGDILTVNYQGACGSCPSSTMGTLKAIEGILRQEFSPNLTVQTA